MSYANSNEKGTPEALCPICTPIPFNITRLRYVRTILTPEPVMIFYCPKCRKEYHEYQVIFSNYTWMYIEEEKESEKKKLEQILLICSECEEETEGKLCRDIDLSKKMFFGCGKWKKDGGFILDQKFYNEIKKRIKLKQVINELLK